MAIVHLVVAVFLGTVIGRILNSHFLFPQCIVFVAMNDAVVPVLPYIDTSPPSYRVACLPCSGSTKHFHFPPGCHDSVTLKVFAVVRREGMSLSGLFLNTSSLHSIHLEPIYSKIKQCKELRYLCVCYTCICCVCSVGVE